MTEIKSEIITKKRKCKLFQGSKTHRSLASSLDDKVIGEFRLSETNSPKNTGINIPLNQSKENDFIAIELLESKERVIRLLMTQSGLFKNN